MNTIHPFVQPRQKLNRAASHIRALEESIGSYFLTDWYSASFENNHLSVVTNGWPKDFGEIVGDAVHNLRAALDLLAVEVVGRNNQDTKGVCFPFGNSADNLQVALTRSKFNRASRVDQSILRSLQPYTGGNHLLRSLHDLDIQDKHHSLIPNTSLITTPRLGVKHDENGVPVGFAAGSVEVELVDPAEAPTVKFGFPPDSAFPGEVVVDVLWQLHSLVSGIIDQFARQTSVSRAIGTPQS